MSMNGKLIWGGGDKLRCFSESGVDGRVYKIIAINLKIYDGGKKLGGWWWMENNQKIKNMENQKIFFWFPRKCETSLKKYWR